ncbi:hypothetical protein GLW08_20545 [Pontibacillus yanchengensis]|uniref:Uncharacterized protein n=2 Tax=Pontibacillus yanchengensis TaxID=462910 RepID=A0ACC7VLW6_9BACI|nr:hypothetical protein [Pontibacillus yanchengensis]MYL35495.1 hypothetical protein [Pontibacillus yanchengensis]MYL55695.1 hypothetical protein [Pontibacillus yanchengensis]
MKLWPFKRKKKEQHSEHDQVEKQSSKRNKEQLEMSYDRSDFMNKIGLTGFDVPVRPKDRGYQCDVKAGGEYPFRSYILDFGNTSLATGELDTLYRAGSINVNFHISKLTRNQAVSKYKRAVTDEGARALNAAKAGNDLEVKEAQKAEAEAQRLFDEISEGYNNGFLGTMAVTMFAENERSLENMGMLIQDSLQHNEHTLRPLYNRQRDGWLSTLPLSNNHLTDGTDRRFFDRTAIVAASPFYSSKIPFTGGVPVGPNIHTNNMEFLNVFAPYLDNYSTLIAGTSGSGKSFGNKHISSGQVLLGYRIFSIDPDGENGPICTLLGGKEVEIREGGNCTINICALTEEEIEKTLPDGRKTSEIIVPIGKKQGHILTFYNKLLGGLTPEEKAVIKEAIKDVIADWGITEDPTSLYEAEKRPVRLPNGDVEHKKPRKREFTLLDIYKRFLLNCTDGYDLENLTYKEITDPDAKRLLKVCRGYLRDQPDGKIFDGQTQFNGEKIDNLLDDICWVNFNIQAIEGSDIYDLVMHVLTQLGWEYFIKRPSLRKYRKRLKIEEAWRMKHVDGAMQFVEELARRSRKYNAGVDIVTQDIKPFLDDPDGEAVVKNATSSIFLRLGALKDEEKAELQSVFGLSEGELEIIARKPPENEDKTSKGECVLRVGGSSAFVKIDVSDDMRAFIDTDPEYLMQNGLMPSMDQGLFFEEEDVIEESEKAPLSTEEEPTNNEDEEQEVIPT